MPKKEVKEKPVKGQDDSKIFAFLATFLSIIGFVIALVAKKDNKYVMFYAKQSLVVFIVSVIGWIINAIVGHIPILGWIIVLAINIIVFVLWLISWINALSGQMKEVPIVGHWGNKINL